MVDLWRQNSSLEGYLSISEPWGFSHGICKINLKDVLKIVGHEINKETYLADFFIEEKLKVPEDAKAAL